MVQHKKKFKERIRENNLKQRHKVATQLRERMGAARRRYNRFDSIDTGGRPLEEIIDFIQEGVSIPVQETDLDPRQLTNLLLQSSSPDTSRTVAEPATTPPPARLSEAPLPADHPLALPDPRAIEEEAQRRKQQMEAGQQRLNKNQYRHHGQSHMFWEGCELHPLLLRALRSMKFTHPTPTQEKVLPTVLESEQQHWQQQQHESDAPPRKSSKGTRQSKDVMVSAETGSGKTLVFALPVLQRLLRTLYPLSSLAENTAGSSTTAKGKNEKEASRKRSREDEPKKGKTAKQSKKEETKAGEPGPSDAVSPSTEDFHASVMHTLIISPTRELALQILKVVEQLCQHAPAVRIGCIVGGMAAEKQQRVLNRHPHILIATPGRLWELVQKNEGCYLGHSISRRLYAVVLDEADRMLKAGKSFDELKQLLARIHCEMLPAGFVQEREEGAEVGEHEELEAGYWDAEKKQFVSYKKAAAEKKGESAEKKEKESSTVTRKSKKHRLEEEEVETEEDGDERHQPTTKNKKDQPRPMPMPPAPSDNHRVITFVTSATLALQTNYERRDFSATKRVIRTSNADRMTQVLQELSIQPSNALVFNLTEATDGDISSRAMGKINETYLRCPDASKDLYLYYFLKVYGKSERTVVFVNAISMLRRLVKIVEILGIPVVGLHAAMQQRQRLKFIDRFRRGEVKVLIATDVASRGLDIEDIRYVLHFQVPRSTDAYIHRCGRTARCGGSGLSLLLVNAEEHVSFHKLIESMGRKSSELELFALQPTVVHQLHSHLRIALQIDKLTKEISKSRAKNQWVTRTAKQAEIDADDMIDDEADQVNREKAKAIKLLSKELSLLQRKFLGSGGKGAFRTGAEAIGAKIAEEKLTIRAGRQTLLSARKK